MMRNLMSLNRGMMFLIFFALLLSGCGEDRDHRIADIASDEIPDLSIHRYGKALFDIPEDSFAAGLRSIQPMYRFFLDGDLDDTLNVLRVKEFVSDPFLRSVADKTAERYPDLAGLEDSLAVMFARYLYYYPEEEIPEVYSYISGVHYEQAVQLIGNVMIIGLDVYLGEDCSFYPQLGMPVFLATRCTPAHILPDCARQFALRHNARVVQEDLVARMIQEGKRLYFMSLLLPEISPNLLIGYTPEQYDWCEAYEKDLWAFVVDNELLFSTDLAVLNKMMQDGPFTSSFGQGSAPRLGEWIGWKIVERYMGKNDDVGLAGLMGDTDAHALFNNSGYRPR